jgi:hypothetical protein
MNCGSQEDHNKSQELFSQAKTYSQFLDLWMRFYINEICIPTYFANFIGAEDNKYATRKMGEKFQEITKFGLIPINFQTNSLKSCQKAYVNLYTTEIVSDIITQYINRYPGFIAFYQDIRGDNCINNLYVTYDPDKDEKKRTVKTGVFFGNPFTSLGRKSEDIDFIQEWLNPDLSDVISNENLKEVIIIDTIATQKSDRVLDLLLNALRDNDQAINSERERLNRKE